MAVFKRRTCLSCKKQHQDSKEAKTPPPCERCGGTTEYSEKWYVAINLPLPDGGTKKHVRAVASKKDKAKEYEAALISERASGTVFDADRKDTSFVNAAKVFREWIDRRVKDKQMAEGTADSYRTRLTHNLWPFFRTFDLRRIDRIAVNRFVDERRERKIRKKDPSTREVYHEPTKESHIRGDIVVLKRIISVAIQEGLIRHSPLEGYEMIPPSRERDMALTPSQVETLLAVCAAPERPPYLWLAVFLAVHTGLRRDGVMSMQWSDIDWRRNEIVRTVKHHRSQGPTIVRIPMTEEVRDALKQWQAKQKVVAIGGEGYVITSPKRPGQPLKANAGLGFTAAACKAGLAGLHFHDLRHTFATLFLEQFPDHIETLRVIMGHSSAYMTRKYAHITDRAKHRAMARFSISASSEGGESHDEEGDSGRSAGVPITIRSTSTPPYSAPGLS